MTARILDADGAAFDPQYAERRIAQLENVALQTLDRKVFVDRADQMTFRLQNHPVIGVVRNGAARRECRQPGALAGTQHLVDRVMMQQRASAPAARAEPFREHPHAFVEFLAAQFPVRVRAAHETEQLVFAPFARRDFGGYLLREDIERVLRNLQAVQFATANRIEHRRAFDQLVARKWKEPPLRYAAHRMSSAADALQERIDRTRRADLADQVHVADVDPKFERSGRHQHLQFTALQSLLRVEAPVLGKAAVMRGDVLFIQPLR